MGILEFMNEIQKQILKYGLGFSLLALAVWYQTERIEKQEAKFEKKQVEQDAKINGLQSGLSDCNAERAALKVQVDNLSMLIKRKIK